MGRNRNKNKNKNKERGVAIPALAPLAQLPQAPPSSQSTGGYYEPQRDAEQTKELLRMPNRLLPLQRAGGLHGLDRPTPKPQRPPETLVRRAATTTPTGTAGDLETQYRKQLMERDAKIAALEKDVKALETQKADPAAAAAAEIAALKGRLQNVEEGFQAAEKVIREQELLIGSLQEQLGREPGSLQQGAPGLGQPPQGQGQLAPLGGGIIKPKSAKEIAAAHAAQIDLLWIDPWVRKGEALKGVSEMCGGGVSTQAIPTHSSISRSFLSDCFRSQVRPQLVEVAHQDEQALTTGLVNLKESLVCTLVDVDDDLEKETLGFFKDFTQEALKRKQTNLTHS